MNNVSKIIKILLFTFLTSLILYISTKNSLKKMNKFNHRKLLSDDNIIEICSRSKEGINVLYTKKSFEYFSNIKDKKYINYLINYLDTEEMKNIENYIKRFIFFFIIISLDIILIFFWLSYCICCCCPNCCFKNKNNEINENNNINKKDNLIEISFIISLIFYFINIISCIIGIIYVNKFNKGLNSMSCSIFQIYAHFIYGDDCPEKPIWNGIDQIKNLLIKTENQLIDIINYGIKVNESYYIVKNNIFSSEDFINEEFNKYDLNDFIIENPLKDRNEFNYDYVIFDYYYDLKKNLNYTKTDYLNYLYVGIKILEKLSNITNDIQNNEISQLLNDSINQLNDIENTFIDLAKDILNDLYDYQNTYNKYSKKINFLVFGLLLLCSILISIGLFLFKIKNIPCMRFLIHITWYFNMFFILIIIIIGVIFGIISFVSKDSVGVMEYIISSENLNKKTNALAIKGNGSEYLNICFNYDGQLKKVLNLNSSSIIDNLNILYEYKSIIDLYYYNLSSFIDWYTNLTVMYSYNYTYPSSKKGYKFYNGTSYSNLLNVLLQLRNYTDLNYNNQLEEYNINFNHYWILNEFDCISDYEIVSNTSDELYNLGSDKKYCFNLIQFTDCFSNYNNITINETTNLCEIWESYKNSIINFYDTYNTKIDILKDNTIYYIDNLNYIKNNTLIGMNEANKMIEPIYKIYHTILGSSQDIFSVLNCRFLNRDSKILFDILDNDLGKNSEIIEIFIFIACFISAIAIFFTLIVILRSNKNENNEIENNGNIDNINENNEIENNENIDNIKENNENENYEKIDNIKDNNENENNGTDDNIKEKNENEYNGNVDNRNENNENENNGN